MNRTKIVYLTGSVSREGGGLFEGVRQLSLGVAADPQFQIGVIGARDGHTDQDAGLWPPVAVRSHAVKGRQRFGYAPGMTADLVESAPDLVHLHGLWQYPSVSVLQWARRTGKPYIVSPHGMMEPWSLKQSRFLKKLAGWLYQNSCLRGAAVLRATSQLEVESIRRAGFKNTIARVANGVVMPVSHRNSEIGSRAQRPHRALFLSRIHPKKGLLNLVEAWRRVQPAGWELLIVGPDEDGHLAEVQAAAGASGLGRQIRFQPEVMGDAKTQCYLDADLFVLPSFSENFGLVIAEALSHGLPVITTRATPWEELLTRHCGWWIELGVEPLAKALREAISLSDAERDEMGRRGRKLMEDLYTWPAVARQMTSVYKWMLGNGPKPDNLEFS